MADFKEVQLCFRNARAAKAVSAVSNSWPSKAGNLGNLACAELKSWQAKVVITLRGITRFQFILLVCKCHPMAVRNALLVDTGALQ